MLMLMPYGSVKPLRFYRKACCVGKRIVPDKLSVCIFRRRFVPTAGVYAEADFGGSAAGGKGEGNRVAWL